MKVLVLGGTLFLGRHIVDALLAAGHDVTLFHRGQTNPDLFPQIERILGDRREHLERLGDRRWDAVIDTCGYLPKVVELSVLALKDRVARYVFISSVGVYAPPIPSGATEDAAIATLPEPTEEVTGESYGPLKAECEAVVRRAFPDAHWILRPGLIVGPWDPTDRFTYWPRRLSGAAAVIAPLPKARGVQWIDARDLAEWIARGLSRSLTGTFNAIGPQREIHFDEFFETIHQCCGGQSQPCWMPEDFLLEQGVNPWSDLPLWLPARDNGTLECDGQRAFEAGLRCRPLAETCRDTLAWFQGQKRELKAGLSPSRAAEILATWNARD